jgi:hypothetical protein
MTTTQRLRQALQALYDEQTGPPCKRHALEWRLAMREAERVLEQTRAGTGFKNAR